MNYHVRDISLEDFVRHYALMIVDQNALKLALLILCGDELQQASTLACNGDRDTTDRAINELIRVGFMKPKSVN